MAEIISFMDSIKRRDEMSRAEALAKGRIKYFSCDDCGADLDVINDEYPDRCPGCGLLIAHWNYADEE